MSRARPSLVGAALILALAPGCTPDSPPRATQPDSVSVPAPAPSAPAVLPARDPTRLVATRPYMGGIPSHLTCVGLDQAAFDAVMVAVDARIALLEQRWSKVRPDSTISLLNAAPPGPVEVDADTAALLADSREFTVASKGVLDLTVEPIVALWKAAEVRRSLPTDAAIADALAKVGLERWSLEGTTVTRAEGVRFDLNAVAEGAMADDALALLKQAGCTRAIVEIGGDVGLYHAPGQAPFRIGIDDPSDPKRLIATVQVEGGAIDTAGDYNRFLVIDGKRYGHIVDPRTGRPVEPDLASATVVAPTTRIADAWDTALFVLGWDEAQRVVEARPDLEAVLIHHDGRVWVSKGLEGKVRIQKR